MRKTSKRDSVVAARVKKTAEIMGVSIRTVQKVIKGDQMNKNVLNTYMELEEGEEELFNNILLRTVERLVPFN